MRDVFASAFVRSKQATRRSSGSAAATSASAGTDYQTKSGSLVFAPGVTSMPVTVTIIGDTLKEFDEFNDALFESSRKAQFLSGIMMPLMQAVGNLNYVIIAILGGIRVANGQLSLGGVQAFIQYSRQFTMPLGQIAALANQVQSGLASAERVFEVLDAVEEELELRGSKQRLVEPRGQVVLDNVSFRYLPDQPLIDHVNVRVEPGKTVAIVGPTGAGKTTIVNLLMRFYDIDEGRITLDGVDTRDIAREDLRSHFGMVLQDTWLFNGTIRENIAFARQDASPEMIERAAREAQAEEFIASFKVEDLRRIEWRCGSGAGLRHGASRGWHGSGRFVAQSRQFLFRRRIPFLARPRAQRPHAGCLERDEHLRAHGSHRGRRRTVSFRHRRS